MRLLKLKIFTIILACLDLSLHSKNFLVNSSELLDLGILKGTPGQQLRLVYVSELKRKIQLCSWFPKKLKTNSEFSRIVAANTKAEEGKCEFLIQSFTSEFVGVWRFNVVFLEPLEHHDDHARGVVTVVESSEPVLILYANENEQDLSISAIESKGINLTCCIANFAGRGIPKLSLFQEGIEVKDVGLRFKSKSGSNFCLVWNNAMFDWKSDGRNITCKFGTDNLVDWNTIVSKILTVKYAPKFNVNGYEKKKVMNMAISYPNANKIFIPILANPRPVVSWYLVSALNIYSSSSNNNQPKVDQISELNLKEFPTEYQEMKNEFNFTLLLNNVSSTTLSKRKILIRSFIKNQFGRLQIDINIDLPNQADTTFGSSSSISTFSTAVSTLHNFSTATVTYPETYSSVEPATNSQLESNLTEFKIIITLNKEGMDPLILNPDEITEEILTKNNVTVECCSKNFRQDSRIQSLELYLTRELVSNMTMKGIVCLSLTRKLTWKDNEKSINCRSVDQFNTRKFEDNLILTVLHTPKFNLQGYENKKFMNISISYPKEDKVFIPVFANPRPNVSWYLVSAQNVQTSDPNTKVDDITELNMEEFPTKCQTLKNEFNFTLLLNKMSATTLSKPEIIIRSYIKNEFGRLQIDITITPYISSIAPTYQESNGIKHSWILSNTFYSLIFLNIVRLIH